MGLGEAVPLGIGEAGLAFFFEGLAVLPCLATKESPARDWIGTYSRCRRQEVSKLSTNAHRHTEAKQSFVAVKMSNELRPRYSVVWSCSIQFQVTQTDRHDYWTSL